MIRSLLETSISICGQHKLGESKFSIVSFMNPNREDTCKTRTNGKEILKEFQDACPHDFKAMEKATTVGNTFKKKLGCFDFRSRLRS